MVERVQKAGLRFKALCGTHLHVLISKMEVLTFLQYSGEEYTQ